MRRFDDPGLEDQLAAELRTVRRLSRIAVGVLAVCVLGLALCSGQRPQKRATPSATATLAAVHGQEAVWDAGIRLRASRAFYALRREAHERWLRRLRHARWLAELRAARATPAPAFAGSSTQSHSGSINWLAIADCESGDHDGQPPYTADWTINGTFDGGLQFSPSTWISAGGGRYAAFAYQATPTEQIATAQAWTAKLGGDYWSPGGWPYCGRYG
jgi:hypothetical protein